MAALVGLSPEVTEELCREASAAGIVQPANFNSPGQIVISGSVGGRPQGHGAGPGPGRQDGKGAGGQRRVPFAAHGERAPGAQAALDRTTIQDARIPVYANVTAEPVTEAAAIRDLLYRQLTSPVRWEQTVRNMVRDGATDFIEIGPGKVLQGLVKRTETSVQTAGYDKLADIMKTRGES